jgi:tetratricopeptide (TPR) repeat protein
MLQIRLREYYERLAALSEAGEYTQTTRDIRHVLQHYPRFIAGYLLLGKVLLSEGQYQQAAQQFKRVLAADPESATAHIGLANVFQQSESWEKAVGHLQLATELSPQDRALRQEFTHLLQIRNGDSAGSPDISRAALGRIYFSNRLYAKATRELHSVLAAEPERTDVQVTLADALWRDGQHLEAVQLCQKILGRLPLALKPNLILAAAWLDSPHPRQAAPFLDIARSLDPLGLTADTYLPDDMRWTDAAEVSVHDDEWQVDTDLLAASGERTYSWQEVEQMSDTNRDDYEVPDWLNGLGDELLDDEEAEDSPSSTETPEDEALPDWLQSLVTRGDEEAPPTTAAEADAATTISPVDLSSESDDFEDESTVPDWLSEIRSGLPEEAEEPSSDITAMPIEAEVDTSGLPDWLQETEPEPEPTTVASSEGVLPEWLEDIEEEETAAGDEMSELPEWLREEELPEGAEADVTLDVTVDEAWIFDQPKEDGSEVWQPEADVAAITANEAGPTEEPSVVEEEEEEEEIPIWLTGEQGPTTVRLRDTEEPEIETAEREAGAEAEMPDWLRELEEPITFSAESAPTTEAEELGEPGVPVWLRDVEEDDLALELEKAGSYETELTETPPARVNDEELSVEEDTLEEPTLEETILVPDWDEMRPPTEEPVTIIGVEPAGKEEKVEPEEERIDQVAEALDREARDAVEIAELPEAADERLQVARQAAAAGNWSQALAIYDDLVGSSELLDQVIDDLEASIQSHPDDTAAYQLLGDAYMKDGRLPSALKTYRKALAKLYQ